MKSGVNDLEPFCVTGLALLCVFLGSFVYGTLLGLQGESYEWAIYLTLGTIFPALILILSLSKRFSASTPTFARAFHFALGLLALLVSLVFVVRQQQYAAFLLAMAQLSLLLIFLRKARQPIKPVSILISFLIIVISWTIAASLLWWSPLGVWFFSGDNRTENIYRFLICFLSLLLVFLNLHDDGILEEKSRVRWWWVANSAAILLIAVASVRSDQLFNTMSYSHWGVIVGPAEMLRQGGWLLWDVPSQYGFLNILLVAALPVKSVWQSAYLINSFLLFASALCLFFVLRLIRPGLKNFCFSLLVTLAAVFLMAGWPPALLGPQAFPSLGPFRFIWCYALLALLIKELNSANKSYWRIPFIGNIVWLMGTLWSSESAVYCAALWLPAYALMALRRAHILYPEVSARKKRLRLIVGWLIVPLLLVATVIGLITIYYLLHLGHGPDWRAFYEYSLAFAGGFFAIPIDPNGPVWQLFLIFCALSATVFYFLRGGLTGKAMSLMAGTWGALWATSSYFVSRSHPNNATVLSPILCIVIGVTLYLLARHQRGEWWARLVKMSFVPFLTILLTATFGNAGFLRLYLTSPQQGYQRNIDTHLPALDPSLLELFRTAQVKANDPIVYSAVRVKGVEPLADGVSHDYGVLLPAWTADDGRLISSTRAWLPATPFVLLAPLPEERRQIYMQRFVARARLSGWLVQNKREASYTSSAWFYDQLSKTHTPTRMFENADWQLIWFEFNETAR
jgi:hypothetical protein